MIPVGLRSCGQLMLLLCALWGAAGTPAHAAEVGVLATAGSSNRLGAAGGAFLPVEAAYRVEPHIDGSSLVLDWTLAPGYYLYRDRFRFTAVRADGTRLPVTPVFEGGRRVYDEFYRRELEVYYQATRVILPFAVPPRQITATLVSQGCADAGLCYPPRTQTLVADFDKRSAQIVPGPATPSDPVATEPAAAITQPPLATLVVFALLGGVILNLMPCVFPVLALKALRLANAHLSPHGKHRHSLAYALGVVLSFVVIALLLLLLRAAGTAVGWGFQLQQPAVVAFLALLFFVVAQGFSGHFVLGARLMNLGQTTTEGHGLRASFMTGVLATVAASPCTAPFMGTALGAALTLPPLIGLLIFTALGIGMALPFLLLTWVPAFAAILPRPGPWMGVFREFLAFPLYLTVIWLLWLLGRQAGVDRVLMVGLALLLTAFATWLHGHARRHGTRALALGLGLLALVLAVSPPPPERVPISEPYSRVRLDALRAQGQPVFVNLTADWCLTCLANERVALRSERFAQLLKARGIVYLRGDWTHNDPEITALLAVYGRSGVPLYLYFPPGAGPAEVLPQLLTPAIVLESLGGETPRRHD